MDEFFIRPAVEGACLRDPVTGDPLAAAGESKARNPYWVRCLLRGDVLEGRVDQPSVQRPRPDPAADPSA